MGSRTRLPNSMPSNTPPRLPGCRFYLLPNTPLPPNAAVAPRPQTGSVGYGWWTGPDGQRTCIRFSNAPIPPMVVTVERLAPFLARTLVPIPPIHRWVGCTGQKNPTLPQVWRTLPSRRANPTACTPRPRPKDVWFGQHLYFNLPNWIVGFGT